MRVTPRSIGLTVTAAALLFVAAPAEAVSGYYTEQCAGCHTPALVGSTANTCNGCHGHGAHPSSAKTTVNIAGATDLASYAPGQTVNVRITGGYRGGWVRAVLFDQDMNQLAVSMGPNGMGGGPALPVTLSAPAPSLAGSYTWNVAWYGNRYDTTGAAFGARWLDDPNNHDHGWEIVATNAFTVSAPTAPAIAFAPQSLDFGNRTIGSSASLSSQVQNTGTANLTVTNVALCAGTHSDFTFAAPAVPFTVAPGAAASVTVNYTATHPGLHSHCLAFTSNAANAPTANLAFTGTGVTPTVPVADVSPLSLDFGATTAGSSTTRTFTVGNVGTAALDVTVANGAGTSAEFAVAPASFSVAPGGSTTVTATYAPTDVGPDGGSFLVQTNDPVQPSIPVVVSGTGVAVPTPHLALDPPALDLGGVTVGASASLSTQLSNGGTAPLEVSTIALCAGTSAEFSWSPGAPFAVAAGGATTLTVTYTPAGAGADAGCLAISSNDPDAPTVELAVQGAGLAPSAPRIGVAPASLPFGSVTVGLDADRTLTVSNTGTAALTASIALDAATSAEYTVSPAALTVNPGASQLATVTYAPSAAGADPGTLVVSSNDPATPTVSVVLSGTGTDAPAPSIALDPAALAFGPVVTGGTATLGTALRNQGSAPLEVSSITRCTGTSAEFSWTPSAPLQVAAGGSATLTVTYAPADLGDDGGCLAIASNDPASATVNLTLSGSGVGEAVPAIALVPDALAFGTVSIGGSAARTSEVRNTGTATLHVSAVTACTGTSAEFGFTPAGPFDVAPGGATTLSVSYTPTDVGGDTGCLAVASDDPSTASASLALAGTGAEPPVAAGDVDIEELKVRGGVESKRDRAIVPRAALRNRSSVEATGTARLTAALDGASLYDQTIAITLRAREDETFRFPPLTVTAGTSGTILWTLQIADEDPDEDTATARTRVKAPRNGNGDGDDDDDDRDDDRDRDRMSLIDAAGAPGGASSLTAGCSTGGGSASLALLAAIGALGLAARRRLS